MDNENLEKVFDFLHQIENLKSTLRYLNTKSGRKESSAEHSWRVALMTFLMAEELKLDIDILKSVKIALVHDVCEAITGDFDSLKVHKGELSKSSKEELEKEAAQKLRKLLPEAIGDEIYSLWKEYEDGVTREAKYIKAIDKIETLTQFSETGYKIFHDSPDFLVNYANQPVKNFPELRPVLKIVKRKLKEEFIKGNITWKKEYDIV